MGNDNRSYRNLSGEMGAMQSIGGIETSDTLAELLPIQRYDDFDIVYNYIQANPEDDCEMARIIREDIARAANGPHVIPGPFIVHEVSLSLETWAEKWERKG